MPETKRLLPVLIGENYEHVMAQASVSQDRPGKVTITIEATGKDGDILADFLTAAEPIALSFAGIPVQPRKKNTKEK